MKTREVGNLGNGTIISLGKWNYSQPILPTNPLKTVPYNNTHEFITVDVKNLPPDFLERVKRKPSPHPAHTPTLKLDLNSYQSTPNSTTQAPSIEPDTRTAETPATTTTSLPTTTTKRPRLNRVTLRPYAPSKSRRIPQKPDSTTTYPDETESHKNLNVNFGFESKKTRPSPVYSRKDSSKRGSKSLANTLPWENINQKSHNMNPGWREFPFPSIPMPIMSQMRNFEPVHLRTVNLSESHSESVTTPSPARLEPHTVVPSTLSPSVVDEEDFIDIPETTTTVEPLAPEEQDP